MDRRPHPEPMVPETLLAPVLVTTRLRTINLPEDPATLGKGNKVMNVVALGQWMRNLQRCKGSRPFSRMVSGVTAPDYHLVVKKPGEADSTHKVHPSPVGVGGYRCYDDDALHTQKLQIVSQFKD